MEYERPRIVARERIEGLLDIIKKTDGAGSDVDFGDVDS